MPPPDRRRSNDGSDDAGSGAASNRPSRPANRLPLARPVSPGRAVPKKSAVDHDYEVVDPPAPARKPKARVVEEEETVAVPRSKGRTRSDLPRDEEEDTPRKKRRRYEEDDEDDYDRPRKRKKKKKRRKGGVEISEGMNNTLMEWAGPVFLMLVGLIMGLVGTIGMASSPNSGMPPVLASVAFVVGQLVWIPIEIIGLFMIGKVFGIEYGDVVSALRNLAAMGFLVSGLMALFDWIGLDWFVYNPLIFAVGIGLFIALFKLDVWEAVVTMFGLNLLSFAFNILMFVVLLAMMFGAARHDRGDFDDDYDNNPSINREFDPDEFDDGGGWDPDAPPPPPRQPGRLKGPNDPGNPNRPPRQRPPFPDDDFDEFRP